MIPSPLRAAKNAFVRLVLAVPFLRRWFTWGIRSRYYDEFGIVVPLSPRVGCPIPYEAAWSSFHEIFVNREYAPAFADLPLPRRWLDFGSHAGFFTTYVLMLRDRAGLPWNFEALLVDADRRSLAAATRLARHHHAEDRLHFLHGLLGAGHGERSFVERPYMSSSLAELDSEEGEHFTVPILAETEILARFPPPYDLLKLDIEGAEIEFISAYPQILRATRFLLVEWHGEIGADGLRRLLEPLGFRGRCEVVPPQNESGVWLFENAAITAP